MMDVIYKEADFASFFASLVTGNNRQGMRLLACQAESCLRSSKPTNDLTEKITTRRMENKYGTSAPTVYTKPKDTESLAE